MFHNGSKLIVDLYTEFNRIGKKLVSEKRTYHVDECTEIARDYFIISGFLYLIEDEFEEVESPTPFLKLKDARGMFAELWMEYPARSICFHDHSWKRDQTEEKIWEKDLLSTPFSQDADTYFCPPDQVQRTLTRLINEGWTILDHKDRTLELKEGWDLEGEMFTPLSTEKVALFIEPTLKYIPPSDRFKGVLYPYQQVGLNWLSAIYRAKRSGILADEMGLGKTIQVLSFLAHQKQDALTLVIAPTSLLKNWEREALRFVPDLPVTIYQGEIPAFGLLVTSYAMLRIHIQHLEHQHFDNLILDEAQAIKNARSKTAQAAYALKATFRLSLSGTPIENSVKELHSQYNFLGRPLMLRRKKHEVDLDLPEKIETEVYLEMSDEVALEYAAKKQELEARPLELITQLRMTVARGKIDQVVEDIHELAANGDKVLIFSQFTSILKAVRAKLTIPYLYLDGQTTHREKVITQFKEGSVAPFLISLKAGGVGLNLQEADYVLIMDPWWNEAVEDQAISRAHRLGRTKAVIVRRYITSNSIENRVFELKASKKTLAEQTLTLEELWTLV